VDFKAIAWCLTRGPSNIYKMYAPSTPRNAVCSPTIISGHPK
jgi:hypothetical protein